MVNRINEKRCRWMRQCCILMLCLFITAKNEAQTFNYKSSEASGIKTARQLYVHTLPDTITVWSNEWNTIRSNPGTWGNLIKLKSNNAFVKFAIDHYYPITERPYTYQLAYNIYGYYKDPNVDSTAYVLTSDTLTITKYNAASFFLI